MRTIVAFFAGAICSLGATLVADVDFLVSEHAYTERPAYVSPIADIYQIDFRMVEGLARQEVAMEFLQQRANVTGSVTVGIPEKYEVIISDGHQWAFLRQVLRDRDDWIFVREPQ